MGRTPVAETESHAQRQHRSTLAGVVAGNYRRGNVPGIDRAVCRDRDSQSLGKGRQESRTRGQAALCLAQKSTPDTGPGREAQKVNAGLCFFIQKIKSAKLSTLTM